MWAVPSRPQIDDRLMMEPPRSFMSFIAARVPQKVPSTEVLKLLCQSAVLVSAMAPQL